MNFSTNLSFSPGAVVQLFKQYDRVLIGLVILALVGFTGYQLSHIVSVQPNASYLITQEQSTKTPSLRSDRTILSQLQKQQSAGSTAIPVTVGKSDPFSLSN